MPLARTREIIDPPSCPGRGIGAFNVIHLEHAEALVAGARIVSRPVILQISENVVRFHGALEPIMLATLAVARAAPVPVAVHLGLARDVGWSTKRWRWASLRSCSTPRNYLTRRA